MTPHLRYGLIGVVIGLILFIINPWLAIAVIAAAVAIPVIAYRMLSRSSAVACAASRDRKQLGG